MSRTIDSRVVEMKFDNTDFEKNVRTSMSTLDRLKQALNFDGATNGLDSIKNSIGDVDFTGMETEVNSVSASFSALQIAALTALTNITNKAVDAGIGLVKSLSVDQITEGWEKYALKTESIQTIMGATADKVGTEFEDQEEQMEWVTEQMDKLNWFTDETSFNLIDMTSNIGKFTSAGVELEDAVTAMEGISNWASVSGANIQTAGRAMYNLSQAMGVGAVTLIDWKSIQNANMATKEFKQTALETAAEMGTLVKVSDDLYQTLEGNEVTWQNFEGYLTKDKWFTSDVLVKVLDRYGSFTDRLNETYDALNENGYYTTNQILNFIDEYEAGQLDLQDLSKKTGVSVDELSKRFEELGSEEMKFGRKAFEASQEAKTFEEAIEGTKDAVSTQWASMFEIIFGNYLEQKELWTNVANELWEVFAEPLAVRNEMLKEWSNFGGRDVMLEAMSNAWENFRNILSTIQEAFRDIFPAMTGERLYSITEKVRDLTEKFKLNDEQLDKLKSTFKGLFAVLDIVKTAFSSILKILRPLLDLLPDVGGGFLDVTSKIGDWIVSFDEWLKTSGTFNGAIEKMSDLMSSLKDKLSGLFDKIKEIFSNFGKVDTSGMDGLTDNVEKRFSPLTKVLEGFKTVFDGIVDAFKKAEPVFSSIASTIGDALSNFGKALSNAFAGDGFNNVLDIVNGGVLISIGLAIKNFLNSWSNADSIITGGLFDKLKGALSSIKGVLDGVRSSLEAYQQNLKASTLLKIAGAVALLSASLVVLAGIDSEKLTTALAAMTAEFAELIGALYALEAIGGGKGFKNIRKVVGAMIPLAAAILILSFAMKNLSELDWDGVLKGLTGVAGLCAILVKSSERLSKSSGKMIKGAAGLIVFAVAIRLLVKPVKELGEIDTDKLAKGLIGVGVLCAELALFLKGANLDQVSLGKGLGLLVLAEAISILATATGKFAEMDTGKMIQGLAGVGVVLTELAVFTKATGNASKVISTAIGLTILAAAMLIFADAVGKFGEQNPEKLAIGLVGMGVSLGIIAAALNLMPKNTPIIAAGMVLVGAALEIIQNAMSKFGEMNWTQLVISLVALAGSLGIIAVAVNAMTGALGGAAALVVVSAALMMIAPVLERLGGMSLGEVAIALITLAGAFAVIGIAATVLTPMIPALLGLGAAIALIGAGTALVGTGLLAFAAGLAALATAGAAGIGILVLAIESIIALIPQILTKVGEGIVALIEAIGNAAPALATAVVQIVEAIILALTETIPAIVDGLVTLLDTLLATLAEHMPSIVQSVMDILIAILTGLRDNIGQIVDLVVDTIINVITAITEKIPDIVQAGWNLIIGLVNGLADGIETNLPLLLEAFVNLFKSILNAVLTFLGIHSPSTKFAEIGKNIILGLIGGIGGMLWDLLKKVGEVLTGMINKIGNRLHEFATKGREAMTKFGSGVHEKLEYVKTKVGEIASGALSSLRGKLEEFKSVGSDLMDGFKNGMESVKTTVSNAASTVAQKAADSAKKVLGIASPSKVMIAAGENFDEGLIIGIKNLSSKVGDAAGNVGEKAIDGMNDAISKISDSIDADVVPTITPVLDLSEVAKGVSDIDSMISSDRAIDLASKANLSVRDLAFQNQNGIAVNNKDIVDGLNQLRNDISVMTQAMSRLRVVMDTGALVGQILNPLDVALGQKVIYDGRGI